MTNDGDVWEGHGKTDTLMHAGHRPIYIDSTNHMKVDGDLTVAEELQDAFGELLAEYNVDVTLHGHHHSYQRTCPLDTDSNCVGYDANGIANGPVHLVIGNAGAGLCLNVHKHPPKVRVWFLFFVF